jgi:oxygen-independent coproporphyrinogen-3 oxidase
MRPNEELETEQFQLTTRILEASGYRQYEISNYAQPGMESRHNMAYWMGSDYIGLGPSAFSTLGTRRWRNIRETGIYTDSTIEGKTAIDFTEDVPAQLKLKERAAFGMRTLQGLLFAESTEWEKELSNFEKQGLVKKTSDRWLLTEQGKLLADSVAEIFV